MDKEEYRFVNCKTYLTQHVSIHRKLGSREQNPPKEGC